MHLIILIGLGVVGIVSGILLIFFDTRGLKLDPERCPHCGEVIDDIRQELVWDDDCPICHGSGQGNGGYTGDSGECTCGYFIRVCPHCGCKL